MSSTRSETKIIFSGESVWNRILVLETGHHRILAFGTSGQGHQTGYDLLAPDEPIFEYPGMMAAALALKPDTKSILILGLGGGYLPGVLKRNRPDIQVTAVEIDPLVISVAEKYFHCGSEGSLTVHAGDGRKFLEQDPQCYDQIWVDAYDERYIPHHLTTIEFLSLCLARLRGGGIFVQNVHSDNPLFMAHQATLTKAFGYFFLIPGVQDANTVLIGRKHTPRPENIQKAFGKGFRQHGTCCGGMNLKAAAQRAKVTSYSDPLAVLSDEDILSFSLE